MYYLNTVPAPEVLRSKTSILQCFFYYPPLGGVADKTAVKERAAGERLNEDLGARGGAPPHIIIFFHQKLPKMAQFAPYYIWGFYEKYDGKF